MPCLWSQWSALAPQDSARLPALRIANLSRPAPYAIALFSVGDMYTGKIRTTPCAEVCVCVCVVHMAWVGWDLGGEIWDLT
jgi:hypothetical protein